MIDAELRRARGALALSFFVQGAVFALLVTRIPAIQDQYGIGDAALPVFLAAVPVLAGAGSVAAEHLVKRVRPSVLLRWVQPLVCLALAGVGLGDAVWQAAVALAAFGVTVGALDASMNMIGVSLQRAYGRSIMLGFHAAYSLGGITGASLAWAGAHWDISLAVLYGTAVAVVAPLALAGSRWYADARPEAKSAGPAAPAAPAAPVSFRLLLPLCLVMAFAYIGDATVSNWSAKYLEDVLHSSEELATVPYNVYMVTTLLGRAIGDRGVGRYGGAAVVRAGALLAAGGFVVVAAAPGAWPGMAGFTLLGFGLSVIVPQTFAAAGRLFPGAASDTAIARLNIFNYVGFLVGAPLVGGIGEVWSYRGAMLVPMVLVLATLVYARSYGGGGVPGRHGGGHERAPAAGVG